MSAQKKGDGCGRIAAAFLRAQTEGRAALLPFVTAGFPRLDSTVSLLRGLADAGADLIELGVPFSDPSADGPVIQRASEIALANGITLRRTLEYVAEFRAGDSQTPLVLMGYANTFFRAGRDDFLRAAAGSGVDGLIVVDLSDTDRAEWAKAGKSAGVDLVSLVAPTTEEKRRRELAELSAGFVYFISLKGITGARHMSVGEIAPQLSQLRGESGLPVVAGFGVRTPLQARELGECADGVVVGSRLLEIMADAGSPARAQQKAAEFVGEVAAALRGKNDGDNGGVAVNKSKGKTKSESKCKSESENKSKSKNKNGAAVVVAGGTV